MDNSVYPVAYVLMSNRKKEQYVRLFAVLRDMGLAPKNVTCDFERGIHEALKQVYSGIKIHGCYFHMNQALYRRMKKLGLPRFFNSTPLVRKICRYIPTLAFVDPNIVDAAYDAIIGFVPEKPNSAICKEALDLLNLFLG